MPTAETKLQNLSKSQLLFLFKRGILHVDMMTLQQLDITTLNKHDLPEYQTVAHLAGLGISISAAARKYNIPQPTISRWVARGLIATVRKEKNRILIDEADIAYMSSIYHQLDQKAGKWIFNPDGTPHYPDK